MRITDAAQELPHNRSTQQFGPTPTKKPPAMLKSHRGVFMALGAATLLAALAFLFAKTSATDFRHDAQALNLLREMHDLDSHWDDDSARLVNDFTGSVPRADFAAMIGRALAEIERAAPADTLRKELTQ